MVLVEPGVEEPMVAAVTGPSAVHATVVTAQAESSSTPAESGSRLENIAAEAAAMLPDGSHARIPLPPPLPASAARLEAVGSAVGGSYLLATAMGMALICVAVLAWSAWSYFGDQTSDLATAPIDSNVERTDEPDTAASSVAATNTERAFREPTDEASVAEQPNESKDNPAHKIESQSADPSARFEPAPETVAHTDTPDSGADSNRSEDPVASDKRANDPNQNNDAPANAAEPTEKPDARVARKPSLEMHELPKPPLLEVDAGATESAGQQPIEPSEKNGLAEPVPASNPADSPVRQAANGAPVLRRIPPREVNIAERLATKIEAIEFRDAPLHEALETLGKLTGVPVSIDIDALDAQGIPVDPPVTVVARSTTIADVFQQALLPAGLELRERGSQLVVGPRLAGQSRKARYAVDDLVRSGDPKIEDLAAIVRQVIAQQSKSGESAATELEIAREAIFLSGAETQHARMIELCEKLRVARGRPLRTRYSPDRPDPRFDPRRFELATRRSKAQHLLARRVTAGIGRPASLREAVEYLADQTNSTILVDGPALAESGLSIETEAALSAVDQPLELALDLLVKPLGLTYRVAADDLVEITTWRAAADRPSLEFYPVPGLMQDEVNTAMAEDLRAKLVHAAGIEESAATVFFDPPSQCLIVVGAYPVQVRLEQALKAVDRN